MTSNIQYPYQMPGLSRYRFDDEGRCLNEDTGRIMTAYEHEGKYKKTYTLKDDYGKQCAVTLAEVKQYIKHLIEMERFDPTVSFTYICYRPIVVSYYKANKPLTDKELKRLIDAA